MCCTGPGCRPSPSDSGHRSFPSHAAGVDVASTRTCLGERVSPRVTEVKAGVALDENEDFVLRAHVEADVESRRRRVGPTDPLVAHALAQAAVRATGVLGPHVPPRTRPLDLRLFEGQGLRIDAPRVKTGGWYRIDRDNFEHAAAVRQRGPVLARGDELVDGVGHASRSGRGSRSVIAGFGIASTICAIMATVAREKEILRCILCGVSVCVQQVP
jgi:hypothetical protein